MSSFTLKLSSLLVSSPSQSSSSSATTSYLPPLPLFRFPRTRFNSRGRVAVVGAAESDKNNSPISGDSKTPNGTLPNTRREILLEYVQNVQPEFMELFVKRAPQQVNGAGDHVIRSLLGSLVHYYPIDQYKCVTHHPFAASIEEWVDTKDFSLDKPVIGPKWHVPTEDEISFANELLRLHFESALDDLLTICANLKSILIQETRKITKK